MVEVASNGKFQLINKTDDSTLTSANGLVKVEYETYNRYYAFDKSGNMLTGLQDVKCTDKNTYTFYFATADDAKFDEDAGSETTKTPENSNIGSALKIRDGVCWYSIDMTGKKTALKGWQTIGGKKYYLNSDGSMVMDNLKKINSIWYAFDKYGVMVTNDFYKYASNGRTY